MTLLLLASCFAALARGTLFFHPLEAVLVPKECVAYYYACRTPPLWLLLEGVSVGQHGQVERGRVKRQ